MGIHKLTGVFPQKKNDKNMPEGPLVLILCIHCELLQLQHSFNPLEMYGDNYGYRSGLNQSMIEHLKTKVAKLEKKYIIKNNDLVVDIGSNDSTLLKCYSKDITKIAVDPTLKKFLKYYDKKTIKISNFFEYSIIKPYLSKKAKIVTSIAMFYDLEDPNLFVSDIYKILSDDGIWHFEQSYMPMMLQMNSYDTICHEHLEYYSLRVIKKLLQKNGFKIIDVELNQINGGSFAVTAAKKISKIIENKTVIKWILNKEKELKLETFEPFKEFKKNINNHKTQLKNLILQLKNNGKKIIGYGASTKGNVLLQYCNIDSNIIEAIAEINENKFNCFTPGTNIKILSEKNAKKLKPDYMLVLPWHFRESIIKKEKYFLERGGRLIFPLPEIEII